jgi:hypothetical protein
MIRHLLTWVASKIPPRIIYDRAGHDPYLSRHYILGRPRMPDGSSPFDWDGAPRMGVIWPSDNNNIGVYLHHFHRGDEDGPALHNHPWRWAISLILAGGYSEERRMRGTNRVVRRTVKPGSLNFIGPEDFHRVDLLPGQKDAWSLFIVGPKFTGWGFWNRHTGVFTPWRQFINARRDPAAFARL